jgi:glutamine amidotransferase
MDGERIVDVAIVDYGMGNLFSVKHACVFAGLEACVTSDPASLSLARAVILPGVGAFGEAMATLTELGFVGALRAFADSGRPLFGICLGLQLLMTESHEFGTHAGLGLIPGEVVKLEGARERVPHVGWSPVRRTRDRGWDDTPLDGLSDGVHMYFVHSFCVRPSVADVIVASTPHGGSEFCSALRRENVFACQFHPERSGADGLRVYQNLARLVRAA